MSTDAELELRVILISDLFPDGNYGQVKARDMARCFREGDELFKMENQFVASDSSSEDEDEEQQEKGKRGKRGQQALVSSRPPLAINAPSAGPPKPQNPVAEASRAPKPTSKPSPKVAPHPAPVSTAVLVDDGSSSSDFPSESSEFRSTVSSSSIASDTAELVESSSLPATRKEDAVPALVPTEKQQKWVESEKNKAAAKKKEKLANPDPQFSAGKRNRDDEDAPTVPPKSRQGQYEKPKDSATSPSPLPQRNPVFDPAKRDNHPSTDDLRRFPEGAYVEVYDGRPEGAMPGEVWRSPGGTKKGVPYPAWDGESVETFIRENNYKAMGFLAPLRPLPHPAGETPPPAAFRFNLEEVVNPAAGGNEEADEQESEDDQVEEEKPRQATPAPQQKAERAPRKKKTDPATTAPTEAAVVAVAAEQVVSPVVSAKKKKKSPKKKKQKDPNAPKKPVAGFMKFMQEKRPEIKANNPEMTFAEIGKEGGRLWGLMSAEEKAEYKASE